MSRRELGTARTGCGSAPNIAAILSCWAMPDGSLTPAAGIRNSSVSAIRSPEGAEPHHW